MFAARNSLLTAAKAQIAYDAVAGSPYLLTSNTTAAINGTFSDTSAGGADVFVAVTCLTNNGGAASAFTRSATYNGVSMTSLGAVNGDNSTYGWLELFHLAGGGTGSAETVDAQISNASAKTFCAVIAQAVSYLYVTSLGAAVTNFGATNSMTSGSVSSATGNRVVQAFAGMNLGVAITGFSSYTQTSRYAGVANNPSTGSGPGTAALQLGDAPGASTVTFSETLTSTSASFFSSIAVPLS